MKVKIGGVYYTLITIVGETYQIKGTNKDTIRGMAYVFDKDRKMHKFIADDIEQVDK